MKDKLLIIIVTILATVAYYYSCIYIPNYCYTFDSVLIDIDKNPDLWKWSPPILNLIASLIILLLTLFITNFTKNIFAIKVYPNLLKEMNKFILFFLCILGANMFVLAQYIFSSIFFPETISTETAIFELWLLPVLIANCIIYPIAEEVFFRKGILNIFYSKFTLTLSIGLSSILFAAFHYPNYRQIVITFIGGILLGILYKKTSKLIYPVVFHISWNTTVIILNFIPFS